MRLLKEQDITKYIYPETARRRGFGVKKFKEIFDRAKLAKDSVVILKTRLDLMQNLR